MTKEEFLNSFPEYHKKKIEHKKKLKSQLNYDIHQCLLGRMNKCVKNKKNVNKYFGYR
ncbi:hypothetical protein J2Z35_001210 [Acetoanaerobium pronyense]|uniref:Uncharacterized protein n=1 Tax=Acetoanaerobium pronyense TaxID=1482736 RepID=A0ABS4KI13_9FIRM|nr:hypothetical protein [Acetoanaerobium pronyense]MBP2027416.1 hypothetical protein [Acetoanaerobium pronyense]